MNKLEYQKTVNDLRIRKDWCNSNDSETKNHSTFSQSTTNLLQNGVVGRLNLPLFKIGRIAFGLLFFTSFDQRWFHNVWLREATYFSARFSCFMIVVDIANIFKVSIDNVSASFALHFLDLWTQVLRFRDTVFVRNLLGSHFFLLWNQLWCFWRGKAPTLFHLLISHVIWYLSLLTQYNDIKQNPY